MEKVSKFEADFGGTEIFAPLHEIFVQEKSPETESHIYLLTDGAVHNTDAIVTLVRE
jgi:hypothetical protein